MNNEILEIVKQGNIEKFTRVYNNIKDEKQKQQIKKGFDIHMKQIALFCEQNFDKNNLTENFIKELHKIHYPRGYKKFKETTSGDGKICTMIPGQYKTLENFPEVKPKDVKKEMKKLLDDYNTNILKTENKIDLICNLILNLLKIHPFGDGNGTVIYILFDLLLYNNGYKPIYIKNKFSHNELYKNIKYSIKNNDISFLKKNIN